jgi:hypothetical protein
MRLTSIIVVCCLLAACAAPTDGARSELIDGRPAPAGAYPWIASLRHPNGAHFCTGSLIDSTHVLTAAHCVEDNRELRVVIGGLRQSDMNASSGVAARAVHLHPEFRSAFFSNDLAVVDLAEPVRGVRFPRLAMPRDERDVRRRGRVMSAGWGVNGADFLGVNVPDVLRHDRFDLVDQRTCEAEIGGYFDASSMLCTYDGDGGACYGDSGGPLFVLDARGAALIVGVTSWGRGCGIGFPSVWARVSTGRDWLLECLAGECGESITPACDSYAADCDDEPGCETDTEGDAANCGGCGRACDTGELCFNGICLAACSEPWIGLFECDGDSACEDIRADPDHCGACNRACDPGQRCANGSCYDAGCADGYADCDGCGGPLSCETNVLSDDRNCGGCGVRCPSSEYCERGSCTRRCGPAVRDCDRDVSTGERGCETELRNDSNNCGGCGITCARGLECRDAQCVCATGTGDCDGNPANGCETSVLDDANCGACGNVCGSHQTCIGGRCTCAWPQEDCDGDPSNGCEASLIEPASCGWCDNRCAEGRFCDDGRCSVCPSRTENCDGDPRTGVNGCEADLDSPASCGECGVVCSEGEQCFGGVCAVCAPGTADCDGDRSTGANGCEADLRSPVSCGACGIVCARGEVCGRGGCLPGR